MKDSPDVRVSPLRPQHADDSLRYLPIFLDAGFSVLSEYSKLTVVRKLLQ